MKKYFELWLDESGDFKNDKGNLKRGLNPSHIGGVLVEKGSFGTSAVERIFPDEEGFHATESEKEKVMGRFRQIEKKAEEIRRDGKYFRYVVFTNAECIMVLDHSVTYQIIMAEGIMRVIRDLKAEFGDIKLEVLIAKRKDTKVHADGSTIVSEEEYKQTLEERMIMSGLRSGIEKAEWSLETAAAKKVPHIAIEADKRLMTADVVCNCFLTRNTKFKGEEGEELCSIYEDKTKTKVMSVLSFSMESKFKELMFDGRIGEAVAAICQCEMPEVIEESMETVRRRMGEMNDKEIEMQYGFLKALFDHYLNVAYAYEQCEKVIKNLLRYFIPVLEEKEIAKKIVFDLNFYLLTVYTHMGNIEKAAAAEQKCDEAFCHLPSNWSMIDLGIKYEQRKVISQINLFDFQKAKEQNEKLIEKCRKIKKLLSSYREDVTYDELGKALGTQVQIETFLLRSQGKIRENYEKAASDSEEAVREFVSQPDIARQYLYRVQLETEAGQYDLAYQYLCLAAGMEKDTDIKTWNQELKKENGIYTICAYVRLMAEGKTGGWDKADALYQILVQSGVMNELLSGVKKYHPVEIILWKYAAYIAFHSKKILPAYKNAIDLCFDSGDLTLNIIGLAIALERYAFALKFDGKKEKQQYKKSLQKKFGEIYKKGLPDSVKSVFGEIDFKEEGWEYYYNLSRRVTY